MRYCAVVAIAATIQIQVAWGQKIDDARMERDIEVAENVLATLIKHEINQDRTFFGLEIRGSYQPGYGVTFRVPGDRSMPFVYSVDRMGGTQIYRAGDAPVIGYSRARKRDEVVDEEVVEEDVKYKAYTLNAEALVEKKRAAADSATDEYYKKVISAAKKFILDYGDFISQLDSNEKIVITNQRESRAYYFANNKRTHVMVEGMKADITAFKQGKISREQALNKLKVVNTQTVEARETDLELLSSIFNRLYQPDLSTTYFSENSINYERLKDYGAIFYMQVYSSTGDVVKIMPTQGHEEMDEATRNKRVTELYPRFEKELKENILEYGRTLKSLKADETLVFNITLTRCEGCNIPSTLELAIRQSALNDFSEGRIDKNAALAQFTVKKGPNQ